MSTIRILCRRPGFRRAGIAHPAVKDYKPGELTAGQLDAIRAEPMLTLVELQDDADATIRVGNGELALAELRAAARAAFFIGIPVADFSSIIMGFIADEWNALQAAKPEAEIADQHGNEVVKASGSEVSSLPDEVSSLAVPTLTGEAEGSGTAAAAPAADLSHQDAEQPANAGAAPAEGAGAAAPSANPPAAKPAKPPRKGK